MTDYAKTERHVIFTQAEFRDFKLVSVGGGMLLGMIAMVLILWIGGALT